MKKIALLMFTFISFLFADNYSTPFRKSGTIKMQTLVGEAAINNVLTAYFAGSHKISIAGNDDVLLEINKLGIDIQGKNEVVLGFDMKVNDHVIEGAIPIQGAFLVQQTKKAYVILMNLGDAIEDILTTHGVSTQSVKSAIKSFFSPFEETTVELWRQTYGALLDNYFNKLEKKYDLSVTKDPQIELLIGNEPNSIAVHLEMELESEKQYFILKDWMQTDGWFRDPQTFNIISNKPFRLLKIRFQIMPNHSLLPIVELCKGVSSEYNVSFDIYEACSESVKRIKDSIKNRDFKIDITVKTAQGGIITIEKELK